MRRLRLARDNQGGTANDSSLFSGAFFVFLEQEKGAAMDGDTLLLIGIVSALFWVYIMLAIMGKLNELIELGKTQTMQNDRIIELLKKSAGHSETKSSD
jgi:hypothetical protein